jgi:hypothetical protein
VGRGGVADERQRDPVHARLGRHGDRLAVAAGDGGDAQLGVGEVDALVRQQRTADLDGQRDEVEAARDDARLQPAVVEQDALAGLDLGDRLRFGEVDVGRLVGPHGHRHLLPGGQFQRGVELGAQLRPRQVGQHRDRSLPRAGQLAQAADALAVLVAAAVREVDAGDVQAGVEQLFEHAGPVRGRSQRGDDARASVHGAESLSIIRESPGEGRFRSRACGGLHNFQCTATGAKAK